MSCKLCGGTWKKYDSFREHVFCKHPGSDLFPLADGSHSEQSVGTSVDEPEIAVNCRQSGTADTSSVNTFSEQHGINRKWTKNNVKTTNVGWDGTMPDIVKKDMTPCFICDLFCNDDVLKHVVSMSKLYASQKWTANFEVTAHEGNEVF